MKRILIISAVVVAFLFILSACAGTPSQTTQSPATSNQPSATAATTTAPQASATAATAAGGTFTGYLIDQKCGLQGIDIQDGTDITKFPEKHTLSCALMPMCIASGYGLSIKQSDGTYKYYKFDANGSSLAKSTVIDKTSKNDNLLVEVKGTLNGDTITVTAIAEK